MEIKSVPQVLNATTINCAIEKKMEGYVATIDSQKDPNHLLTVFECKPFWEISYPKQSDQCKVGFFRDPRCDVKQPGARGYHEHMISEYVYFMDIPNLCP